MSDQIQPQELTKPGQENNETLQKVGKIELIHTVMDITRAVGGATKGSSDAVLSSMADLASGTTRASKIEYASIAVLIDKLGSKDYKEYQAAFQQLAEKGSNATPQLIRALKSPDEQTQALSRQLLYDRLQERHSEPIYATFPEILTAGQKPIGTQTIAELRITLGHQRESILLTPKERAMVILAEARNKELAEIPAALKLSNGEIKAVKVDSQREALRKIIPSRQYKFDFPGY